MTSTCAVCLNSNLEEMLSFPNFPLTGIFSKSPMEDKIEGIDLSLLTCLDCNHVQLSQQVSPNSLYNSNYHFRTSSSTTSKQGTDFFLSALNDIAGNYTFNCVLDLGCNDAHLLRKLKGKAENRVGIDPIWAEKENQDEEEITIFGETIESIDLFSALPEQPDLIVCRHTLEHIWHPRKAIKKLIDISSDNTLLLFEVPGFIPLISKYRFDQIFHQHLQYFTVDTFTRLIGECGCTYLAHWENYHHWGSFVIAFKKETNANSQRTKSNMENKILKRTQSQYAVFRQQMATLETVLKSFEDKIIYGYGAAQMLPSLAYHMKSDLSILKSVLDDDSEKDGLYYWNLPLSITQTNSIKNLDKVSILITAVDNAKPIISRLLDLRPQHIIYPFNII